MAINLVEEYGNVLVTAELCMPLVLEAKLDVTSMEWHTVEKESAADISKIKSHHEEAYNRFRRMVRGEANDDEIDSQNDVIEKLKIKLFENLSKCTQTKITLNTFLNELVRGVSKSGDFGVLTSTEAGTWLIHTLHCLPEQFNLDSEEFIDFIQVVHDCFGKSGLEAVIIGLGVTPPIIEKYFPLKIDVEREQQQELPLDGKLWFDIESLIERWKKFGLNQNDIRHEAEIGNLEICINCSAINEGKTRYYFGSGRYDTVSPLINFKLDTIHIQENGYRDGFEFPYLLSPLDNSSPLAELAAIDRDTYKRVVYKGKTAQVSARAAGFRVDLSPPNGWNLEIQHLVVSCREVRRYEMEILKKTKNDSDHNSEPALTKGAWLTMGILYERLRESPGYRNKNHLVLEILEKYPNLHGVGETNLHNFLAQAERKLEDKK
ncbi:hypothetical protein [Aliiglaciecola sp. M165]|uniref:hypothetical protein n=1 Tax=Aliiglaciecola sp. M165 TaxID=2593649 RepID=UPI00117C97E0|nr:hypothetical protein [Aliiglaciecola sp. M165]TRY30732.1 hypothetical protein FM019_12640 [Aliiglaciecola sp. M165]